jgi:hypothetical protein
MLGIPAVGVGLATAVLLAAVAARGGLFDCGGDCSGDRVVTIDELVGAVNIALGGTSVAGCARADRNDDGRVTIDELVGAVGNALVGCGEGGLLASGIQFVPESRETIAGSDRTRLLRLGPELIFTDGSDTPVKALHLGSRRIRPLTRRMGVPAGLALGGGAVFWTESRSGIAPSGCVGPGVIRRLNRTSIDRTDTVSLAQADDCARATGEVVVARGQVFWVSSVTSPDGFRLMATPAAGGASTTVRSTTERIDHVAADATHLYWLETKLAPGDDGSILRRPLGGGDTEVVFDQLHYEGERQGGFAVANGFVFFANPSDGVGYDLMRVAVGGGLPQTLAEIVQAPRAYAVSGPRLYWIDEDSLDAMPTDGGAVEAVATALDPPVRLAAAAGGVVWSESLCCAHGQKGRVRFFATPGPPRTLVDGVDSPDPVASDGSSAFWGEGGEIGLIEGFGRVATVPLAGGAARTLTQGVSVPLPAIATDGAALFVADRFRVKRLDVGGGPAEALAAGDFFVIAVAADERSVYWAEDPFSLIRRVPSEGGVVEDLAAGSGPTGAIAVDGSHVYWSESLDRIRRVTVDGGQAEDLASGLAAVSDLIVEAGTVFFSEQDSGGIAALNAATGIIRDLAVGLPFSWHYLAQDAGSLYWINQIEVGRVAKGGGAPTRLVTALDSIAEIGNAVAVDEEAVYWAEVRAGTIRALPR